MQTRDYKDVVAGTALIAIGAFAAIYAVATLQLGTLTHMGPGLFPVSLGCLLVALGLIVVVPALFRAAEMPKVEMWAPLMVLCSILAFALMAERFGLLPAVVALTAVASRADRKLSPLAAFGVGIALSVIVVVIFEMGLGLQLQVIAWPW